MFLQSQRFWFQGIWTKSLRSSVVFAVNVFKQPPVNAQFEFIFNNHSLSRPLRNFFCCPSAVSAFVQKSKHTISLYGISCKFVILILTGALLLPENTYANITLNSLSYNCFKMNFHYFLLNTSSFPVQLLASHDIPCSILPFRNYTILILSSKMGTFYAESTQGRSPVTLLYSTLLRCIYLTKSALRLSLFA